MCLNPGGHVGWAFFCVFAGSRIQGTFKVRIFYCPFHFPWTYLDAASYRYRCSVSLLSLPPPFPSIDAISTIFSITLPFPWMYLAQAFFTWFSEKIMVDCWCPCSRFSCFWYHLHRINLFLFSLLLFFNYSVLHYECFPPVLFLCYSLFLFLCIKYWIAMLLLEVSSCLTVFSYFVKVCHLWLFFVSCIQIFKNAYWTVADNNYVSATKDWSRFSLQKWSNRSAGRGSFLLLFSLFDTVLY